MPRIIDPATGHLIRDLPDQDAAAVAQAARTARAACASWQALGLARRSELIARFRDLVAAEVDALAWILTSETGKPITQARAEVSRVGERIDFFLTQTPAVLEDQVVFADQGMEERLVREPLGVIGIISAWNYPWFVGCNVLIPALLAGNTVLYKPSEHATLTGMSLAACLHRAGVPVEVLQVLIGGGATGAALCAQDLDGICFTGSYATGCRVAGASAVRLIRTNLELGGKDAVYVAPDVDIPAAAAATADGAFYNAGQSCCAIERLYVHADIHDRFVEAFVAEVGRLRVGEPSRPETYLGPLARQEQIGILEAQVADAVAQGGRVVLGGHRLARPGWWFAPTVILGATQAMTVMRDESFGPIIGIMSVADDAQALTLMNDSAYGLTAGVFSRDRTRALAVLARLRAGTAYWNCCDRVSPRLPWSGRGWSGMGTTLGRDGILAMTQPKSYHLRQPT